MLNVSSVEGARSHPDPGLSEARLIVPPALTESCQTLMESVRKLLNSFCGESMHTKLIQEFETK